MSALFHVELGNPEASDVLANTEALRSLCQKEAAEFSQWLATNEPNFSAGLADWERQIIAVYLYKKVRKLDEEKAPTDLPEALKPST